MNQNSRIMSIDVARGLTLGCMIMVNNPGKWNAIYTPLEHASWNGLTPTDLVFPFFMFIMGLSVPLSLKHYTDRKSATWRIIRRTVLLYLVGLGLTAFSDLCNNSFSFSSLRLMGVLHRLALAYGAGALITLFSKKRYIPWISAAILAFYIIIMQLFNGYVHSPENLIAKIDVMILGASHLYGETADGTSFAFDPEGLLSSIPGIAHVLLGVFACNLMTSAKDSDSRSLRLSILGTVLLFSGFLLHYLDPINKKLWTSTFVLVTCGACSLLLSLLEQLISKYESKKWTMPFRVFGSNALFIYSCAWILAVLFGLEFIPDGNGISSIQGLYVTKVLDQIFDPFNASLCYALTFVLINWLIAKILYDRKIFIRL